MKNRSIYRKATAVLLALTMLVTLALCLVSCDSEDFDYLTADLGKYIYLDEQVYTNYPTSVILQQITDADVTAQILYKLAENKGDAKANGALYTSGKLGVGDEVRIWYKGYTVNEDNTKNYFSGGTNFAETYYTLEIGSNQMISGFEAALIGMEISEHRALVNSQITQSSVICVTYSVMKPDGTSQASVTELVDLADPSLESVYGEGFASHFVDRKINSEISDFICKIADGDVAYTDVSMQFALESNAVAPYVIEVTFPNNYHEASLRSVTAYFEIYAGGAVRYNAPEFTDEFITDVLEVSAEELSEYEGDTLTDRYREMIHEALIEAAQSNYDAEVEEQMWEYLHEQVVIYDLPESEVQATYMSYYNMMKEEFDYYESYGYYDDIDEFAKLYFQQYFEISSVTDWRQTVLEMSEYEVVEQCMFFYIVREQGLLPSVQEFGTLYDDTVNEYLIYYIDYYSEEFEDLETDEEYEAAVAQLKEEMLDYYGEKYFSDLVYYNYAIDTLLSYHNNSV